MALKQRRHFADVENVESVAAGVAADPNAPAGEWFVRLGTIWQASHPVVQAHPAWFVPLGDGQTSPCYFPEREPSS